MSNHYLTILLGSVLGITVFTSCQPLSDPYADPYPSNRSPIETTPSVITPGAELFEQNPLVEFQATGINPAPIRTLPAGQTLTILSRDGRFTLVSLPDGTAGYINSKDISEGSTGGYNNNFNNRIPDQDGNRFGGGNRNLDTIPPDNNFGTPPDTTPTPTPPAQVPDVIDLDNI